MAGKIFRWMVCFSLALACMVSAAGALMWVGCTECGEDACAQDEGELHRWVCDSCGHSWTAFHELHCDEKVRACSACGNTENMDGIAISHISYGGSGKYLDEYKHVYSCECGEEVYESLTHFANCMTPTVCVMCGASENVVIDYLSHGNTSEYFDLGDTHATKCFDCGEIADEGPHWGFDFNDGKCFLCGKVKEDDLPGDADESEGVSISDSIAILRYLSGADVTINTTNADVNGDGEVDEKDALRLLQYAAGWDVNLE